MKLGLGTVQFGLNYGVTNARGQTGLAEVKAILGEAARQGCTVLDTASLYGEAESVLGQALPGLPAFRVVTKTTHCPPELPTEEALAPIRQGLVHSLERLGQPAVAGLLVHRVDDLLGPHGQALFELLQEFQAAGLVSKIGASVYTSDDIARLLARYPIELVQFPLNGLDQRALASGSLQALAERGVEIHVRSAFLQGLLLTPPDRLPARITQGLPALVPPLAAWHRSAAELGLTPLTLALGFLKGLPEIGTVICGATSLGEWSEIVAAWAEAPALPPARLKKLAVPDDKLIDPRFWPAP